MPKKHRLTRADFESLSSRARRLHGRLFILTTEGNPSPGAGFACVVSKKVALRAHDRNLIKRRFRASIRDVKEIESLSGMFVFTAKKTAKDASYKEIFADVQKLLSG